MYISQYHQIMEHIQNILVLLRCIIPRFIVSYKLLRSWTFLNSDVFMVLMCYLFNRFHLILAYTAVSRKAFVIQQPEKTNSVGKYG